MAIEGFGGDPLLGDVHWERPHKPFEESPLYELWENRVIHSNNDFVVVITAASKSAGSGTGKTTAAINLSRNCHKPNVYFNAEDQATLKATQFARGMMADPGRVPDGAPVILDEAQGTLAGDGVDARRSMANSVIEVTTAIGTLRYRQLTTIIITQNTKWIDKRVDDVIDALVIIQDRQPYEDVEAVVFETYYNDLQRNPTRYTDQLCSFSWEPIPHDDPDYQHLHELKERSAEDDIVDEDDTPDEPSDELQKKIAQNLRNAGLTIREIADTDMITYSEWWVSEHTDGGDDLTDAEETSVEDGD